MFFTRLAAATSDPCFRYVFADFYRGEVYLHLYNMSARAGFLRDIQALFDMSMIADMFQEEEYL